MRATHEHCPPQHQPPIKMQLKEEVTKKETRQEIVNTTTGTVAAGHSSTPHHRTRRHQEPLSSLLTSPPSQGDASKEVTTPKRRRHPIRGIWGFHPGERGRKELGVEPRHRLQGGSARSAVVAVTSPPVKGFPRAKAPSSIHPDEATDPVRPGPITSGMGATWTRSSSSDPAEGRRGGHRAATPSHRLLTTPAAKERGPQHRRTPPAQIGAALTSRGRRPRCRSSPREGEAAKSSPPPSLAATNGLPAVASGGGEGKDEDGRGSRGG
jgi:hypothetical protein